MKKMLTITLILISLVLISLQLIKSDSEVQITCGNDNEVSLGCFGDNEVNLFGGRDSVPPLITITNPISETMTGNESIKLNFTILEYSSSRECWFKVVDDSNNIEINNQTLTNCANTTFNLPNSDSYNLTLYANDTFDNVNQTSVFFRISLEVPAVNLNNPTDNQWFKERSNLWFNFTATDFDGIENCSLYSNFSGSWALNESFTFVTSGIASTTKKNLSEGISIWNAQCLDKTLLSAFALSNYTVNIDLTPPTPSFTTANNTNIAGLSMTFNYVITDDRLINSCTFTLRDSNGNLHNYNANTSMDCGTSNRSITIFNIGTYTITIFGNDQARNANSTQLTFTSTTTAGGGGGGGSGGVSIKGLAQADNFSVTTINFKDQSDLILAQNSTKPRTQKFVLINRGLTPITVNVACNSENVNKSSEGIDMCQYIRFPQETFTVPANSQQGINGEAIIYTPETGKLGDSYFLNIVALNTEGDQFSKLSVKTRVTILGLLFKWGDVPFQSDIPSPDRVKYPVAGVSFIISLLSFIVFLVVINNKRLRISKFFKTPLAGFLISLMLFSIVFVLSLMFL